MNSITDKCIRGHDRIPENTYVNPSGYPTCRLCANLRRRAFHARNRERMRESIRLSNAKQEASGRPRLRRRINSKLHRLRNPEKTKARQMLQNAVRSNKVIKPNNCEHCNEPKRLDGHHHDYSLPLDVKWLCRQCHAALHNKLKGL